MWDIKGNEYTWGEATLFASFVNWGQLEIERICLQVEDPFQKVFDVQEIDMEVTQGYQGTKVNNCFICLNKLTPDQKKVWFSCFFIWVLQPF